MLYCGWQGGMSGPVGRIIASPYANTVAREKGVTLLVGMIFDVFLCGDF